jgi:hypothetical protein
MQESYQKSLQIIKELNIKSEKEYNKIAKERLLLSSESLKYISQIKSFYEIIKVANES